MNSQAYDDEGGVRSLLRRALFGNPRDAIGCFLLALAAGSILVNALHMQPGPHPAPIFAIKQRPVAASAPADIVPVMPRARPEALLSPKPDAGTPMVARQRADIISDIQRELSRRGLYDGPADGVIGPKTDAAIRDFETSAKMKPSGEPTEDVLKAIQNTPVAPVKLVAAPRSRPDPIADLIAPASRVMAVQRALNDFAYGPVKATGTFGPETVAAIQKFERDRKMPVTGQISPRLMRELAAATGRPLE